MMFWLIAPAVSFLGWLGIDIALTSYFSDNVTLVPGMTAEIFFSGYWIEIVIMVFILIGCVLIANPKNKSLKTVRSSSAIKSIFRRR